MSVTVKVQFGDKLFKLSPGITSLEQVNEEMMRRYPKKLPALEYYFEGEIVHDLAPLLYTLQKGGKSSIKITARNCNGELSRISDYSFIEIVSSEQQHEIKVRKAEQPVVLLEEKLVEVQSKAAEGAKKVELPVIEYHMPREFYACYNCEGGVYESAEVKRLCEICQGRGELNNDHKYIQHLKKLFGKHIKPVQQAEEVEIVESKKEFPRVFRGLSKVYELQIKEVNRVEKMEVGKEFTYQFSIQNNGKDLPEDLQIVNCDTKEAIKVKTLRSGEKMVVELGPFKCPSDALLEQAFYLCYRVENGWERLGYRFGLRVRGVKNVEVKKMEWASRDMIRNLKTLSGSRKSEDYLAMKLKEMDIDLSNVEIEDELLIEIIRMIK